MSPRSSKRVDTSQKDAQKITHPDDDDDADQGGGCFDATRKKRTDRRNRRHDFPELKFVQDGGFTGGIETNLRAFFRALREDLFGQYQHTSREGEKNSAQPTDSRIHSTLSKSHHATPRRGEAADVPPHRISQNSKTPASFSSGRCPLRPPLLQRAIKIQSSPFTSSSSSSSSSAVRFDDE